MDATIIDRTARLNGTIDQDLDYQGILADPGLDADEHRRITERAYELYVARGEQPGDDFSDWLEAERQIRRS